MRKLFLPARVLAAVTSLCSMFAAVVATGLGAWKTVKAAKLLVGEQGAGVPVALIGAMDAFLIAAALVIFAAGIYELFVGPLELSEALEIKSLDALKAKLAGIIVLVLSAMFLEQMESGAAARELLETGAAVAMVGAMLTWFTRSSAH